MRLINHHEVVSAPIEILEAFPVRLTAVSGEVRVGENGVSKLVARELREGVVPAMDDPVFAELFGANDEHLFVAQLEVFDDGERLISFAEAHAVGEDAAVVIKELVDRAFRAVLLKGVEHFPDLGIEQRRASQRFIHLRVAVEFVAEKVEQREEINELRRVRGGEAIEVSEHFRLHVLGKRFVLPNLIEPRLEIVAVAAGIYDEIEFDIVALLGGEPEPRHGEI